MHRPRMTFWSYPSGIKNGWASEPVGSPGHGADAATGVESLGWGDELPAICERRQEDWFEKINQLRRAAWRMDCG